jgi:N-acetylglucosaminyldiphosphoundecaprenol N-acetyl-beta-D-mannosaminyltransferase
VDGVWFDNINRATAVDVVRGFLSEGRSPVARVINFVNVHSLALTRITPGLDRALRSSDLVLPDGSGLAFAGRVRGMPVRENLNGTDFTPLVLAEAESLGRSVYLLGARREVLEACVRRLRERFPGLVIAGARHGHFSEQEAESIVRGIRAAGADLLLVGMGSPLQELWMDQFRSSLGVRVCMGVGGLFDFLSGLTPRAPRWMRRAGMEWLYRFAHNPAAKWERVLVEIPLFVIRTLAGRVTVAGSPTAREDRP